MKWNVRFAALLLLWAVSPAQAQEAALEVAGGYAGGNYIFVERTDSWWLSGGVAVEAGTFTFRVTFPIWLQNSTVISGTGVGGMATGGSSSGTVADSGDARVERGEGMGGGSRRGNPVDVPGSSFTDLRAAIGDPVLGITAGLINGARTALSGTVSVKVPVADTAHFGTEAWDIGALASLTQRVGSRFALGVTGAYWFLGDMPGLEFSDVVRVSGTVSWFSPTGWGLSASAWGGNAAVAGYAPVVSVGAGLMRTQGAESAWGLTLDVGLTESTPDVMLGATWRVAL